MSQGRKMFLKGIGVRLEIKQIYNGLYLFRKLVAYFLFSLSYFVKGELGWCYWNCFIKLFKSCPSVSTITFPLGWPAKCNADDVIGTILGEIVAGIWDDHIGPLFNSKLSRSNGNTTLNGIASFNAVCKDGSVRKPSVLSS